MKIVGIIKEVDKLGRIVIPKELRERYGLLENVEIIESIDKAIMLLKAHKLLLSNKTYFVEKKQRILIIGVNSKYSLSYEQFKELYKDNKFIVYEESEENFDFSRYDEYYSWKHK